MSQPDEWPSATSVRAASSAAASSPPTSASASACSDSNVSPATWSARSAALIAWLAVRASAASRAPIARHRLAAVDEHATEQRRAGEIVARRGQAGAQAQQRPRRRVYRLRVIGSIRRRERRAPAAPRDRAETRASCPRAARRIPAARRRGRWRRRDGGMRPPRRRGRRAREVARDHASPGSAPNETSALRATGCAVSTARGCTRRQPRPDPHDLAGRLEVGRVGKRRERPRDPAARLQRRARLAPDREHVHGDDLRAGPALERLRRASRAR